MNDVISSEFDNPGSHGSTTWFLPEILMGLGVCECVGVCVCVCVFVVHVSGLEYVVTPLTVCASVSMVPLVKSLFG